jgi:uncharacterized protein (DUF1778 family)
MSKTVPPKTLLPKTGLSKAKSTRLSQGAMPVRLDANSKVLIKRAAELSGVPVSQFVRQHVLEAAQRTIGEQQVMKLSLESAQAFATALASNKANAKLSKLFKRHQHLAFRLPKE